MRNSLILIIALIGLASCNNPSQKEIVRTEISIDSIKVMPNWEDGSIINLELTKTKTVMRNGKSQSGSSTSNVELLISKNNNNTWNGKWSIKDIKTPKINNPLEKKIENLAKGFEYNFVLDSTGIITELTNWKDIQAKGFDALELIIDEIKDQPTMNPQIVDQIRMGVGEMFNSKEKIETYLMQEVQLFFALNGYAGIEMTKNDTLFGVSYITHPLTGDFIEQTINTTFEKAYSDSTCDIQISQIINNDDLQNATKNTVIKVGGDDKASDYENEMKDVKFDVIVVSNYNYSLKTGLVEKVTATKTITVGTEKRIDKTEIILK
jgi:hypothetical protein